MKAKQCIENIPPKFTEAFFGAPVPHPSPLSIPPAALCGCHYPLIEDGIFSDTCGWKPLPSVALLLPLALGKQFSILH